MGYNTQNAIRINHMGFLKKGSKHFILTDNKDNSGEFVVEYIIDVEYQEIYRGKLEHKKGIDGADAWIGEFSDLEQEGDFVVKAGGYTSRPFVIYDGVYDYAARIMLEYFKYQRCGSDLGWNGKCHTEDGYIKETGKHVDLSGGYHQSCDLRKSPGGVAIGVLGMLRYAIQDKSAWGKICFADEVEWACDYYVKNIQENGMMYNTLSEPFGWEGRVFYESPAPSSAQWCTTSILALGYLYFKKINLEKAESYLEAAIRSWNYMISDERSDEVYRHPDKFPRGMDPDHFYDACYKGSSGDLGYMAVVAMDLYNATGNREYLRYTKIGIEGVIECALEGELAMCLRRDKDSSYLLTGSGSYAWTHSGLMALGTVLSQNAIEIPGLEECAKAAADALCNMAEKDIWGRMCIPYSESDMDKLIGHPEPGKEQPTRRKSMKNPVCFGECNGLKVYYNPNRKSMVPTISMNCAIFLQQCAVYFKNKKYSKCAQNVFDALLGVNYFDASHVNSIGYNQVVHKPYGQFFPSTPFIPGAIDIGFDTIDVYEASSEYDMPSVGIAMYLIAELKRS